MGRARTTNGALLEQALGVTLPDVVSDRSRQVEGLVTRSDGTVLGRVTSDGNDDDDDGRDEVKQEEAE